jgi:hypothetical protein
MSSDQGRSDGGRVGDDTLARIDGLADGWSVDKPAASATAGAEGTPPAGPPPPDTVPYPKVELEAALAEQVRPRRPSAPPPPPPGRKARPTASGPVVSATPTPPDRVSPDRSAAVVSGEALRSGDTRQAGDTPQAGAAGVERARRPSGPPPPPGAPRTTSSTAPPPPPGPARTKPPSSPPPPPPGRSAGRTTGAGPAVAPVPREISAGSAASASGAVALERRAVQVVSSRDADSTVVTAPEPAAPLASPPGHGGVPDDRPRRGRMSGTGTLRIPIGLPRRRGVLGDVQYVYTVAFGVARARRQLAELDRLLDEAKATRDQRLIELGKQAVADSDLALPAVELAREQLYQIEELRSQRAGQIAACDEELATLARERDEDRVRRTGELASLRAEIERIAESIEPVERQLATARRKAQRLGSQLGALDDKIVGEEAGKGGRAARPETAAVEATIASLRAERETIAAEEPVLAAVIDDVEPKLASLRGHRGEAERKIAELEQAEKDDVVRVAEIRAAIVARKTVEERAVADLSRANQAALRELAERLYVDRPAELDLLLPPVERSDLRIGELQRRVLELGDLLGAVNRRALLRGIAWLALAFTLLGGLVAAYLVWLR